MDCHVHLSAPCAGHVKLVLHKSSDDSVLGTMVVLRSDLAQELSFYDTARERIWHQILAIALAHKGETIPQIKTAIEAAVIRI